MGTLIREAHPTLEFAGALDQLKEEHETLRGRLQEFAIIYEIIRQGKPNTDWFGTLRDLKKRVESFLELLGCHADWECRALFPTVALYSGDELCVVDVLEEDHRLAVQYMEGFLNELRRSISPIEKCSAMNLMELLINAYYLLIDHFRAEEQYIYPVADEILEDIDYLSC